jgi:hypothetical protein
LQTIATPVSTKFSVPVPATPLASEFGDTPFIAPRGPAVSTLLAQVRAAAPYLFESGSLPGILTRVAAEPEAPLEHDEYFELCLAAHWATVASFVPTDVDHLIRFSLWHESLAFDTLESMARTVLAVAHWDDLSMTNRRVLSPVSGEWISGHTGEWFSVAVAAYGATRTRAPSLATQIREAIEFEVTREARIYLEVKKAGDGIRLLTAAALIAENLTKLDRVVEIWGIRPGDALYDFAYRASHAEGNAAARFAGALSEAGRLSKTFMVAENDRAFLLRAPRVLRESPDFLLPVAPFFDDWGGRVAVHSAISPKNLSEIVENLYLGWRKSKGLEGKFITSAYPRAVAGILEALPGGLFRLGAFVSPETERSLKSGLFRSLTAIPQSRFEEKWASQALSFVRN